jgi:hypothetical protein
METDATFMEPDTLKVRMMILNETPFLMLLYSTHTFKLFFLQLLIETVLPNDFTKGVSMGLHFCEIIEDTSTPTAPSRFPLLAGLVGLLLFPTVYEPTGWIIEPSNLEKSWSEGRGSARRQILIREYLDEEVRKAQLRANGQTVPSGRVGGLVGGGNGGSEAFTLGGGSASVNKSGRDRAGSIAGGGASSRVAGRRRMSERSPFMGVAFSLDEEDEDQKRKSALEGLMTKNKEILTMIRTEV